MSKDERDFEKRLREEEKERRKEEHEREKDEREREREQARWAREQEREGQSDWARHERMARASEVDPRDLNRDGEVTPQEAAAYIKDLLQMVPESERKDVLTDYFRSLGQSERAALGQAMEDSPASPVQRVDRADPGSLADAYSQTAGAAVQLGKNPLEQVFTRGGAAEQLVKAGLIGLAAVLGSRALEQYRQKQAQPQGVTPPHPAQRDPDRST